MEWSGRAPALWRVMLGGAANRRSTAMSNTTKATIATMGIDIGKNSFHVVGLDRRGAIVLRQKWSRHIEVARLIGHVLTLAARKLGIDGAAVVEMGFERLCQVLVERAQGGGLDP